MAARAAEFDPPRGAPLRNWTCTHSTKPGRGAAGGDVGLDVKGFVDDPAHVGHVPAPHQAGAAAQVEQVDLGIVVDRGLEAEAPQVDGNVVLDHRGRGVEREVEPGAGVRLLLHRGADVALVFHLPGQLRRFEDGRHPVGPEIKSSSLRCTSLVVFAVGPARPRRSTCWPAAGPCPRQHYPWTAPLHRKEFPDESDSIFILFDLQASNPGQNPGTGRRPADRLLQKAGDRGYDRRLSVSGRPRLRDNDCQPDPSPGCTMRACREILPASPPT